jgi:hypothetical protein
VPLCFSDEIRVTGDSKAEIRQSVTLPALGGSFVSKEGVMGKFVKVATKSEIANQSAKCVEIEDRTIALFKQDQTPLKGPVIQ